MSELATSAATNLVPEGFAEKAMASLMQLHSELMDEKEKRVDLFRRLMEREQSVAELKWYVKVLEEQLARVSPAPAPKPAPPTPPPPPRAAEPSARAPVPPTISARPRIEGWKTW